MFDKDSLAITSAAMEIAAGALASAGWHPPVMVITCCESCRAFHTDLGDISFEAVRRALSMDGDRLWYELLHITLPLRMS